MLGIKKSMKPLTLDEHAGYSQAARRLEELRGELTRLQEQRRALAAALAETRRDPDHAALALLDGAAGGADEWKTAEEIRSLDARITTIARAVALGQTRADQERAGALRSIAAAHFDEQQTRTRRVMLAACELAEALEAERLFRLELHAAGVGMVSLPVLLRAPTFHDGTLGRWLRAALEAGLVQAAEIPPTFRELVPAHVSA